VKHRVRLHGKKPRESLKRQAKPAPKKLTAADVVKAVRHRDWPTVRQALIEKLDPLTIHVHGDPLILAVTAIAPVRVVQAVLKAGADPNALNNLRETALHHASDPKVVELLLAAGANPNHRSKLGVAPIHKYAARGLPHAIDLVAKAGADLELGDDEGRTPLLRAVSEQKPESVTALLAHKVNLEALNKQGHTGLQEVVRHRTAAALQIVPLLLAAGADPQATTADGEPPLLLARTPEAVNLLLRAGADMNAVTRSGETALLRAVRDGEEAIVRLLLAAKADPSVRVSAKHPEKAIAGKTPRELAATSSSTTIRKLFAARKSFPE
jgi:ankyrin repeat protein